MAMCTRAFCACGVCLDRPGSALRRRCCGHLRACPLCLCECMWKRANLPRCVHGMFERAAGAREPIVPLACAHASAPFGAPRHAFFRKKAFAHMPCTSFHRRQRACACPVSPCNTLGTPTVPQCIKSVSARVCMPCVPLQHMHPCLLCCRLPARHYLIHSPLSTL